MAKKQKPISVSGYDDLEDKYEMEECARTLKKAGEILADKEKLKKVMKYMDKEQKSIAKLRELANTASEDDD